MGVLEASQRTLALSGIPVLSRREARIASIRESRPSRQTSPPPGGQGQKKWKGKGNDRSPAEVVCSPGPVATKM